MKNHTPFFRNPVSWAFLISILYWIYLGLTTRMIIEYDAIGYEFLGKMLAQQRWWEFFQTGPHREPVYPLLVAFSMQVGNLFSAPYQIIQVALQVLLLFITQLLLLHILRLLKVNNLLCGLTILYLGISPAIVNSALSLYSEIATYPLILGSILLLYHSWNSFYATKRPVIYSAVFSAILFILMLFSRAVLELLTPFFLFLLLAGALMTKNRKVIVHALIYLLVFSTIFYSAVFSYKWTNKKFNNHFAITNRGAWLLYGSTARRTEPLNKEKFLSGLAYIPGKGVCQKFFNNEVCDYWSFQQSDGLGLQKLQELVNRGMTQPQAEKATIALSLEKATGHPAQYLLLWMMEAGKMLFWESTQIGFVTYPEKLTRFFAWAPFSDGLRLVMSLLTLFSLVYLAGFICRERKKILDHRIALSTPAVIILPLTFAFILSYAGVYALFCILTRYALPLAPLYLIAMAFSLQQIIFKSSSQKSKK